MAKPRRGSRADPRLEAERARLLDESARLRAAAAAHPDLMIIFDEEGTYLDIFTSSPENLFKPAPELLGRRVPELFEPGFAVEFLGILRRACAGEAVEPYEYEMEVVGGRRWYEGRAAPAGRDPAGRARAVFIARDVSARRAAEEALRRALADKDLLFRELQHRVKNNLAMMSSIFSIESARSADPAFRAVFADAEDRLRALSLVYESLYRSGELLDLASSAYLGDIARALHRAHVAGGRPALRLELAERPVDLRRAVVLGLALAELLTNAYKYGFAKGAGEELFVGLSEEGEELALRVEDDGEPLPACFDPAGTEGTGLRLVSLLAAQLEGRLTCAPGPDGRGARFELRFPARGD